MNRLEERGAAIAGVEVDRVARDGAERIAEALPGVSVTPAPGAIVLSARGLRKRLDRLGLRSFAALLR